MCPFGIPKTELVDLIFFDTLGEGLGTDSYFIILMLVSFPSNNLVGAEHKLACLIFSVAPCSQLRDF